MPAAWPIAVPNAEARMEAMEAAGAAFDAYVIATDGRLAALESANPPKIGAPVLRTVALGSAYQATTPAKAALVTVNVLSTSSNALLSAAQASQVGDLIIGSTAAAVTAATGTKVGLPTNTQGGVLVIGLTITQGQSQQLTAFLPAGWYFGVRQTTGANLTVPSAYDQTVG